MVTERPAKTSPLAGLVGSSPIASARGEINSPKGLIISSKIGKL